jgi:putative DNA primase/helicase
MDAESIVSALGGRMYGSYGMCCCPAHNDRTPSLTVTDRRDSPGVLVHCQAGCWQEAVVAALKRCGLWPKHENKKPWKPKMQTAEEDDESERFHRAYAFLYRAGNYKAKNRGAQDQLRPYLSGRGISQPPPGAMYLPAKEMPSHSSFEHPAMVMPIINEQGRIRGSLVTMLTSDGTKNLRNKEGKAVRYSYGPKKGGFVPVTSWPDPDRPLIVAEGVEKAAALAELTGYAAIASLGTSGMKSLQPPPCSRVLIANDNDDAGREAARALAGRSWEACIVPPPGRYKDWDEALLDSDSRERARFRDQFLDAEPVAAEPEARALTMREVLKLELPPLEYLMQPWLMAGSLVMIYGQRGSFKTRFAMAVAHASACGRQLLDCWKVPRPANVLYVDGELPTALLQKRLQLLGDPTPNLHIVSRDILLRGGITLPDLGRAEGRAFLDKIIEQQKSELIVLDSLSTLVLSGIEVEAEHWVPIQDWLLRHRFRGRSFVLVHHENRAGTGARGTSKREDVLDTIVKLKVKERGEEESGSEAASFELSFTKNREFHGAEAEPLLLQLSTQSGLAVWSQERQRDHVREQVRELAGRGMKHNEIAKEVGLSRSRVSHILAQPAPGSLM